MRVMKLIECKLDPKSSPITPIQTSRGMDLKPSWLINEDITRIPRQEQVDPTDISELPI